MANHLEVHASPGAHILPATEQAVALAKLLNLTVILKFNDRSMYCHSGDDAQKLVEDWYK